MAYRVNDELERLVHDAASAIQEQVSEPPLCVLLFGSAARAGWAPPSDIDLLYLVSSSRAHRARLFVDQVPIDVFVEPVTRLQSLLEQKEPVVVRMLAEGKVVSGAGDALLGMRTRAAAMLREPRTVSANTISGMRMRAVTLLSALTLNATELDREYLFCLLVTHAVNGYFASRALWPVGERSSLRFLLERDPGIEDAYRTILDRQADFQVRRHAAHRICTLCFNGLPTSLNHILS